MYLQYFPRQDDKHDNTITSRKRFLELSFDYNIFNSLINNRSHFTNLNTSYNKDAEFKGLSFLRLESASNQRMVLK